MYLDRGIRPWTSIDINPMCCYMNKIMSLKPGGVLPNL